MFAIVVFVWPQILINLWIMFKNVIIDTKIVYDRRLFYLNRLFSLIRIKKWNIWNKVLELWKQKFQKCFTKCSYGNLWLWKEKSEPGPATFKRGVPNQEMERGFQIYFQPPEPSYGSATEKQIDVTVNCKLSPYQ